MASFNTKPATPRSLLSLLVKLYQSPGGTATAQQLETDAIRMQRLAVRQLVEVAEQVNSGRRGRPAHIYKLTKLGRDRARRASQKVAA